MTRWNGFVANLEMQGQATFRPEHDDRFFTLGLSACEKADLVHYLKSP